MAQVTKPRGVRQGYCRAGRGCGIVGRLGTVRYGDPERIIKVQKRNRALVTFDEDRICRAVLRASETINGFRQDYLPGINDKIFEAYDSDERIAEFIADAGCSA